jgi:hypothetical protein
VNLYKDLMQRFFKQNIKKWIILAHIIFSIFLTFSFNHHPEKLIWSDMEGYYCYLPSVFIYHDFVPEAIRDTNYLKPINETGKVFTKYTCGVALLELPFFLISHCIASTFKLEPNGKSAIYGIGLMISALFYYWLGIFILYKYARNYCNKAHTIIALIAITLGTNLLYYIIIQPSMSHVYSFFLFAAFLYLTDTIIIQRKQLFKYSIATWLLYGICVGLIVLIRPTNSIILLFPLSILFSNLKQLIEFLQQHILYILLALLMIVIVFIPQLIYWHYVTHQWFMWSYGNEHFIFGKQPKLGKVLFGAWNGWILYSPIVLLPLLTIIMGLKSNKYFERIVLLIFCIATYLFASWWAWWFGGAFGHRCYVEFLTLLVIPFALSLKSIQYKFVLKIFIGTIIIICCYYSVGLTFLYQQSLTPWDGADWTYTSLWMAIKQLY